MTLIDFFKFLGNKPIDDYIVKLRYKYSWEDDWNYSNEILECTFDSNVYTWHNDWNEGYDEVEVLGYISIANVDVPGFKDNNLRSSYEDTT